MSCLRRNFERARLPMLGAPMQTVGPQPRHQWDRFCGRCAVLFCFPPVPSPHSRLDSIAHLARSHLACISNVVVAGSPEVEFIFFNADPWRLFNLLRQACA